MNCCGHCRSGGVYAECVGRFGAAGTAGAATTEAGAPHQRVRAQAHGDAQSDPVESDAPQSVRMALSDALLLRSQADGYAQTAVDPHGQRPLPVRIRIPGRPGSTGPDAADGSLLFDDDPGARVATGWLSLRSGRNR